MTYPTPVNARTDEPISRVGPFGHSPALKISAVQPAGTAELISPRDQIALELKALRQQALITRAGIEQLQLEQQNQSPANLLSALPGGLAPGTALLGIGMLILGGGLAWSKAQRLRSRSWQRRQEFVDSYSPPNDSQESTTWKIRESARVSAAALPEAVPTLPPESEFSPDAARLEVACDLDVNLEDLLPIKASEIQAEVRPSEKTVAKIGQALEFDREAAADEVERVLKSLASKRAARFRRPQKTAPGLLPEQDHAMVILPPFDPANDGRGAANEDRSDQEAALAPDQPSPAPKDEEMVQPQPRTEVFLRDYGVHDQQVQPVTDLQPVFPVEPTVAPGQDTDDQPDHEVQLSLAREFEALGLTHGARELATEVLTSPDNVLSSSAQVLLRQIEDQELADTGTRRHSIF